MFVARGRLNQDHIDNQLMAENTRSVYMVRVYNAGLVVESARVIVKLNLRTKHTGPTTAHYSTIHYGAIGTEAQSIELGRR